MFAVKLHFDDIQSDKNYKGLWAYGRSKLAEILFAYELARKLSKEHANVSVNVGRYSPCHSPPNLT